MDIQGISTSQILTVGIFLVGLIFLQIFITKNKNKFSSKWRSGKRIHLVEEKSLSTTEKIRIISIDNHEYLIISNKGKKSTFITLNKNSNNNISRKLPKTNYNHNTELKPRLNLKVKSSKATEPTKSHELSKAIKLARQMNPAVSYKLWDIF